MTRRLLLCLTCAFALPAAAYGCTQSSSEDPQNREPDPDGGVINPLCTAPPEPVPPEPTDTASRLVSAAAEVQRLQCECAVDLGAYACIDNCEADLFKLEPNGDAQCLRDLLATTLEEPAVECQLGVIEDVAECVAAASCDLDASEACVLGVEVGLAQCPTTPQGFEVLVEACFDRSGERLTELYSESLDAAFEEGCRCATDDQQRELCLGQKQDPRVDCLALLADLDPLARTITECLIEYLDEETEFLADEDCCEDPDDFACRDASAPIFSSVTSGFVNFLAGCPDAPTNDILYAAIGTLSDAMGGDAAKLDGATLVIRVQANPAVRGTPLSSGMSERALWEAVASYTITDRPDGAPDLVFAAPTTLFAVNRFDPDAPQLPGGPPDSVGFEASNGFIEGVEVGLPSAQGDYPGHELYSDRESPLLRSLPPFEEALTGGALSDASGDGAFAYDFELGFFDGDPVPVVDVSKAVAFCMGPEPPPPFDLSTDPGRCGTEPDLLTSGELDDFMTVSRSAALFGDGTPRAHFLVVRRDEISDVEKLVKENPTLAELDSVRPLVIALEFLDQSVDDSCEVPGVVSLALPGEVGAPPDFDEVADLIEDAQQAIETLRSIDFDALQQQLYEAVVEPIKSAACFAARGVVNVVIKPKNTKRLLLNQAAKIALGCPG